MVELEKLNERISQLTELVKTGSEAIKNMETALRVAEEERDRLADQRREQEQKFERVKEKEKYYFINNAYRSFVVTSDTEMGYPLDETSYNSNNYYHTEQRAQEVVNKINFLLKLERLHDAYCPEYEPNYNNEHEPKWTIYFSYHSGSYKTTDWYTTKNANTVCFPTKEIAEKVCDVLNTERTVQYLEWY